MAKMQLEAAEAHPRSEEILAALDPKVSGAIRCAGANEWISAGYMCELMQAAYEVGGEELAREVAKSVATRTREHPFFRPLVNASLRLFGKGPPPYLKFLRRAWGLVMKDACGFTVDINETDARIELSDLPPEMDRVGFKHSWVGTVMGILEIAQTEATVDLQIGSTGFALEIDWG